MRRLMLNAHIDALNSYANDPSAQAPMMANQYGPGLGGHDVMGARRYGDGDGNEGQMGAGYGVGYGYMQPGMQPMTKDQARIYAEYLKKMK